MPVPYFGGTHMIQPLRRSKKSLVYRIFCSFLVSIITLNFLIPANLSYAQVVPLLNLPLPGSMVGLTPGYNPVLIKGITLYPDNPLEFDFLINSGNSQLEGEALKDEANKLIKYFLASLTVPEKDLWVNLSPYEKDRIIPNGLGITEMGRDLLAQDYVLKQLTASLVYPEDNLGKEFWKRVYKKAQDKFGTTDIPLNTFNKIWIVPNKAVVYEKDNNVFVIESSLKVMLEEDYLALQKNLGNTEIALDQVQDEKAREINKVSSEVVREVLLPEIEKEVNEGKNFANLRQIHNSLILAVWYKMNLKESLLGQVYADKNKVKGVDVEDPNIKEKIYQQYLEAFKKGAYDYIKEDYDAASQQIIPRQYFSGGADMRQESERLEEIEADKGEKLSRVQAEALRKSDGDDLSMHTAIVENAQKGDLATLLPGGTTEGKTGDAAAIGVEELKKIFIPENVKTAEISSNLTPADPWNTYQTRIITFKNGGRMVVSTEPRHRIGVTYNGRVITVFSGPQEILPTAFQIKYLGNLDIADVLTMVRANLTPLSDPAALGTEIKEQVDRFMKTGGAVKFLTDLEAATGKSQDQVDTANPFSRLGFDPNPRLGWAPSVLDSLLSGDQEAIDATVALGDEIYNRYKYVIFSGMGGSGLSVELVKSMFEESDSPVKIFSLRSTDPEAIYNMLEGFAKNEGIDLAEILQDTLVIASSKSGTTTETLSHIDYLKQTFKRASLDPVKHVWLMTDPDSAMDKEMKAKKAKADPADPAYDVFYIQLNRETDIGGRFTSPLTNIFLLPLAILAPLALTTILERAQQDRKKYTGEQAANDPYIRLGAFLHAWAESARPRDQVTFLVPSSLREIPRWAEQLFEESNGKDGKGVTVHYDEGLELSDLDGPQSRHRVFVRINVGKQKTQDEFAQAAMALEIPVFDINIDSEDDIGAVMMGLQLAVANMAVLWDINFVNQPGVEDYKKATTAIMADLKSGKIKDVIPPEWKSAQAGIIKVFYSPLIEAKIFTEEELKTQVEAFGATMENPAAVYAASLLLAAKRGNITNGELAVYSHISEAFENILRSAQKDILSRQLGLATKRSEGPDRNHSHQQHAQQGRDNRFTSVFLPEQFSAPVDSNLPIFDSIQIKAQAVGTVQALAKIQEGQTEGRAAILVTLNQSMNQMDAVDWVEVAQFFDAVHTYLNKTDLSFIGQEPGDAAAIGAEEILTISREKANYWGVRLGLPQLDEDYLRALYAKYLEGRTELRIDKTFMPSALLPDFNAVNYRRTIAGKPKYLARAQGATLVANPLDAGKGTSFKREETLERLHPFGRQRIGAKSQDSYFEDVEVDGFDAQGNRVKVRENISVLEMKVLHYLYLAGQGIYKNIILEEFVSPDSRGPINEFLDSPYLWDRVDQRTTSRRTYRQVIALVQGLELAKEWPEQRNLPTIDAATRDFIVTNDPNAFVPGGHGFLANTSLKAMATTAPQSPDQIRVLYNGDGTNNFVPGDVVGWMLAERIPIVMLTTTKMGLDKKGGLIGDEVLADGKRVPQMFETAQAERTGQKELFSEMGLSVGTPGTQLFNTNVAVANESLLHSFLADLMAIVGEEKFAAITTPDLITSPKTKKIDGNDVNVFQLEGAMGSALLNLNKYLMTLPDTEFAGKIQQLMRHYGITRLVHFVNFDPADRPLVFTPEKYTYDHYLYAATDLFEVDLITGSLIFKGDPNRPLPGLELHPYYQDLENDYRAFGYSGKGQRLSIRGLNSLTIRRRVHLPHSIVTGHVILDGDPEDKNEKVIDLTDKRYTDILPHQDGRLNLNNIYVRIENDGTIHTSEITTLKGAAIERVKRLFSSRDQLMQLQESIAADLQGQGFQPTVTNAWALTADGKQIPLAELDVDRVKPRGIKIQWSNNTWAAFVMPEVLSSDTVTYIDIESADPAERNTLQSTFARIDTDQLPDAAAIGISETRPLVDTGTRIAFGTSGWRGRIGIDFIPDNVYRAAQGVADYFNKHTPGKTILLGYDTRRDNPKLIREVAEILAGNGIKVNIVATESTPTPALAYLAGSSEEIEGVVNLTASHSPATDDGFKFSPGHGGAADKAATDEISQLANDAVEYKRLEYANAQKNGLITEINRTEVVQKYIYEYIIPEMKRQGAWDDIVSYIKANPDFRVVLDPLQGTAVEYMRAVYGEIAKDAGREFFTMIHTNNNDPDFKEVNGEPRPDGEKSNQALTEAVRARPNTVGILSDGDMDRFGVVDFGGRYINANILIALRTYFRAKELGEKGVVGKTVATSNFVNAVAEHLGLDIDEEKVGFKWFVENVVKKGRSYLVAGEESAHAMEKGFEKSWDDGLVMGLMALWTVARTKKSLSDYQTEIETAIGKKFYNKAENIKGTDDSIKDAANARTKLAREETERGVALAQRTVVRQVENLQQQKVKDLMTKDGIKIVFESGDSILMRPSGTEFAIMKLYVEVTDESRTEDLLRAGEQIIRGETQETQQVVLTVAEPATVEDDVGLSFASDTRKQFFDPEAEAKEKLRETTDPAAIGIPSELRDYIKTSQRLKNVLESNDVIRDWVKAGTGVSLSAFGLDSLDIPELILHIEDEFEFSLDGDRDRMDTAFEQIGKFTTLDQLIDFIEDEVVASGLDWRKVYGIADPARPLGEASASAEADDRAAIGGEQATPVGGINLDPRLLDLQIKRDGNGVPLPLFQQPIGDMKIEGFFPVIINITPVSLPLLLGLNTQDAPTDNTDIEQGKNKFYREKSKDPEELTVSSTL